MAKVKQIVDLLDKISEDNYGRSYSRSLNENICVMCGEAATEFKDELSRKEYSISAMCQSCQDKVFGG